MIISVHIPKTAGMAFRTVLQSIYGNNIYYDYETNYKFTDPFKNTPKEAFFKIYGQAKMFLRGHYSLKLDDKCIHGHFAADKYDYIFPGSKKITWVRDPVERVISQYYYWQRHPDRASFVCNALLREKYSLIDFASLDAIRNYQSKFLRGQSVDDFTCVGIQEYFDESMKQILKCLEVDMHLENQFLSKNKNPNKKVNQQYDIPANERRIIQELNSVDYEFYNSAVNKFHNNNTNS